MSEYAIVVVIIIVKSLSVADVADTFEYVFVVNATCLPFVHASCNSFV